MPKRLDEDEKDIPEAPIELFANNPKNIDELVELVKKVHAWHVENGLGGQMTIRIGTAL